MYTLCSLLCFFIPAPNSSYSFQVRGNTSAGYSNFSVPQGFETDEDGRFLMNKRERERERGGGGLYLIGLSCSSSKSLQMKLVLLRNFASYYLTLFSSFI